MDEVFANPDEHSELSIDEQMYANYKALQDELGRQMNLWEKGHNELEELNKSANE